MYLTINSKSLCCNNISWIGIGKIGYFIDGGLIGAISIKVEPYSFLVGCAGLEVEGYGHTFFLLGCELHISSFIKKGGLGFGSVGCWGDNPLTYIVFIFAC